MNGLCTASCLREIWHDDYSRCMPAVNEPNDQAI
jgi:hypothetical protein